MTGSRIVDVQRDDGALIESLAALSAGEQAVDA
jgi:hypothetical protein